MPKQVLFVQGAGEAVHDEWDDKLVRSLKRELGDGYSILYPRMPNEADPHYWAWKTALLGQLDKLNDGAILIGHSVGGTILIHLLAEQPPMRRPAPFRSSRRPSSARADGPAMKWRRAGISPSVSPPACLYSFITAPRMTSSPSATWRSTRRRSPGRWCAASRVAAIRSRTI
jgi:pimeloyl-ACP methyl ester carboxylesterase